MDIYLFFKMILLPQFGNFPKTSNETFIGTEVNLQINLEIIDNFTTQSHIINDYFSYYLDLLLYPSELCTKAAYVNSRICP